MSVAAEVGKSREIAQLVSSTSRLMGKHEHDMDQEARDIATSANAKIHSHEAVCAERWRQNSNAMTRLEGAMGDLQKAMDDRIGKIPAGIIAAMGTIIGFLAAKAWPVH